MNATGLCAPCWLGLLVDHDATKRDGKVLGLRL
jgi:hypothetical protein